MSEQHRKHMEVQQEFTQLKERNQMLQDASPMIANAWQDICSGKVGCMKQEVLQRLQQWAGSSACRLHDPWHSVQA